MSMLLMIDKFIIFSTTITIPSMHLYKIYSKSKIVLEISCWVRKLIESEMKKSENYIISKNFAISGRKGEISGRIKVCFQYAVGGVTYNNKCPSLNQTQQIFQRISMDSNRLTPTLTPLHTFEWSTTWIILQSWGIFT